MIILAIVILLMTGIYFFAGPKNKFQYIILLYMMSIALLMAVSTVYLYKLTNYSFSFFLESKVYQFINLFKPGVTELSRFHNLCIGLLMLLSALFVLLFTRAKHLFWLLCVPVLYFLITNDPKLTYILFLRTNVPGVSPLLSWFVEYNRYLCTALFVFYTLLPFGVILKIILRTRIYSYRKDCAIYAACFALFDVFVYLVFFRGIFKSILFSNVDLLKFPHSLPDISEMDMLLPYSFIFIVLTVFVIITVFHPLLGWKVYSRREAAKNARMINQNMKNVLHTYKNAFLGIHRLADLADAYTREGGPDSQEKLLSCVEQLNQIASSNLESITHNIEMLKNVSLKFGFVNLVDCIESAVQNAALPDTIRMEKNYDQNALRSLRIYGDFDYLQEGFVNLLSNAEYALKKKRHPDPVIRIQLLVEPEICSIEIWDNGCGIERDQVRNVFKAFYSTKSTSSNFGLGLNYVESIVKLHHGNISAKSELGRYTSFQIVLPLYRKKEGGRRKK